MRYEKEYVLGEQVVYLVWQRDDEGGFWDLFVIEDGKEVCINLGEPLWEEPTLEEVQELL